MEELEEAVPAPRGIKRRSVLLGALAGAGSAAAVGLTAAATWPSTAGAASHAGTSGTAGGGHEAIAGATPAQMDEHHKAGVERFVENVTSPITEGVGAKDLPYRMEGGVRVFELTCQKAEWEFTPGETLEALTYNGTVPGPTIRCVEGQPVRVIVRNGLDESTAVHWHGQRVPNGMDGVPFITQDPIKPGEEFVYEFVPGPFGSHMYHSHHNAAEQVTKGMLGALIVEPADRAAEPAYDLDYLYILNDVLGGFTINGKGFPATAAYTAKLGQRIRFRFMNEGLMVHPIHLHGLTFEVFARDGYPLPQPFRCDTITVAPGERWDAIVVADNPGIWAFHCHILSHAESPTGMFGMVSALIIE